MGAWVKNESSDCVLDTIVILAQADPYAPFPLLIDEFPYLAEAAPGLETVLQRWWDYNRLYEVADSFLAFWYRFIDPRRGAIRRVRTPERAAEIAAEIDDYIARSVFERICREWVWEQARAACCRRS